ncbi:phage gp6-like head-tail connector protein [Vagococcus carniphilus]|uniref:head-tail connector protein n=1 Tax=Vagococcus carniphilus TaxID=218144 RepID=UPI00288E452B|nr:head-tail connector protein [Vagococcus carniphilus]MDT2850174.1 phage gp6-like head-tail connector protein [Vagococcus carniphilus]
MNENNVELSLEAKLKQHIGFEEGMDDSMLSSYLEYGKKYAEQATGKQSEHIILMVASMFYDFRVPEKELGQAMDALTPFFVQEVFSQNETEEETDK